MELATGFDTCMLPSAHRLGPNDAPATPTALAAENNVDYPLPVFLAVSGAAALHATWNAWVHGGSNPPLHTARPGDLDWGNCCAHGHGVGYQRDLGAVCCTFGGLATQRAIDPSPMGRRLRDRAGVDHAAPLAAGKRQSRTEGN